ncbi:MFS transporter [Oxalobacteraceae bacterium]|nr:MFS transporter [Oxalobacteraceae bacterium]
MRGASDEARPLSGAAVFCLVFLPFALGHYLSCLMRTVNAILVPQLVAELGLTPGQLGLLTSAFFLAFALAQLPVGLALDRFGPRLVQLPMLMLAALGALAFAGGRDFTQLLCARAVIGLGLGGCFMAAVKALSTWIAPGRLPSVHGYLIAAGGLGSASATLPVRLALQYTDWRGLFTGLAAAAAITGLLIWLLAPRQQRAPASLKAPQAAAAAAAAAVDRDGLPSGAAPAPAGPKAGIAQAPVAGVWQSVCAVYAQPGFRAIAGLVLVPHTIFFGIQGLWIGRWLSDVAHCDERAVAYLLYLSMAAVIFGAISVGMLTEWAGRRGIAPLDVAACGVGLFVLVQIGFVVNAAPSYQLLSVLFTLVGTITGIEYALVSQSMPPHLTGRAATSLNLLIFLGAFGVQAGFGQIIGLWEPRGQHYPALAYQVAFAVLVLLQIPGLAIFVQRRRSAALASGRMEIQSGRPAV